MTPELGHRVLVIDGDPLVRNFLSVALDSLGYGVGVARDGAEGVLLFLPARPDCVLCDVNLGIAAEFRRHDASVPVVGMSATYPADLRKPFTVRQLAACLDRVFGQELVPA